MRSLLKMFIFLLIITLLLSPMLSGCKSTKITEQNNVQNQNTSNSNAHENSEKTLGSLTIMVNPNKENPSEVARLIIKDGNFGYLLKETTVSPDNKWMPFITSQKEEGLNLWILSLYDYSVYSADSVPSENTEIIPIGWDKEGKLLYLKKGLQNDENYKNQKGISLWKFDPVSKEKMEVSFIPTNRMVNSAKYIAEKNSVFIHIPGSLWKIDLDKGQTILIKDNLPNYDGLFYLRLSPTGDYCVYVLHEQDKEGIYLLETSNGTETPIKPNGETYNFFPSWSPDGKYIAYHSAPKDPKTGRYDILEGEDYPLGLTRFIEVANPQGQQITRFEIQGKKIGNFRWSSNGKFITFISSSKAEDAYNVIWDALYIADLKGNITKITDLPSKPNQYVEVLYISNDGSKIYYTISSENNKTSLWLWQKDSGNIQIEPKDISWNPLMDWNGEKIFKEDLFISGGNGKSLFLYKVQNSHSQKIFEIDGYLDQYLISGKYLLYRTDTENPVEERLSIIKLQ